jgi:hypothetical protein
MGGGGEDRDSTASMVKRTKDLEEQQGIRKKEGAALPSSHRHASATRSDREDGGSSRPTRTDQYINQIVVSEAFLTASFRTGDGSFLPVSVAVADAPCENILLSFCGPRKRHGRANRGMSSTARPLIG